MQNVPFVLFLQIIKLSVETKTAFPPEERRLDGYQLYQWTATIVGPLPFNVAHKYILSGMGSDVYSPELRQSNSAIWRLESQDHWC